jgi:hypothetical protein
MYTLIETAKLNGVDPQAWLADVLARLPDHPARQLDDLLPWSWTASLAVPRGLSSPAADAFNPRPSPDAYHAEAFASAISLPAPRRWRWFTCRSSARSAPSEVAPGSPDGA